MRLSDPATRRQASAAGDTLRVVTCGSVDDGKSTLIGRLLYEARFLYDDQLVALEADSRKFGTQGDRLDFSLLLDGLAAEREQKITIDVAYRYFATETRHFIVADAPGHEQYTRNMITGASTADAAVILVDARKGIQTQTRRHSYLVSLIGIRHVVLAVNKLDLVGFSEAAFASIESDYRAFAMRIGIGSVVCIPLSALDGDNVTSRSVRTPWYQGPSLMEHLESLQIDSDAGSKPFRLPVQWVNRPDDDFRGFSGRVVSGSIRTGDRVHVYPSGKECVVARIVTFDGDLECAETGRSITLTLDREIDVSRGDLFAAQHAPPGLAQQFEATLIWMGERELVPGQGYLLKIGSRTVAASVAAPRHKIDVNTQEPVASATLELNEIGVTVLSLAQPIPFDPYTENRDTGGFILIDRVTNATVAAGLLHQALRRSQNIHWQSVDVDKKAHVLLKGHRPCIVWLTGLSGAGKSTIANLVEKKLHSMGLHTYLLDGDNVRHGLNQDLDFSDADRVENIRRVAQVARLMVEAGLIVLVSFISPFRSDRLMARNLVTKDEFCEVFIDAPLAVAEARDTKGLYKKARRGELKNFTGIDSPYEVPDEADVVIDTVEMSADQGADAIIARLGTMGVLVRT